MRDDSEEPIEHMPELRTAKVKTAAQKVRSKEKLEKSWRNEIIIFIVLLILGGIRVYFKHSQ